MQRTSRFEYETPSASREIRAQPVASTRWSQHFLMKLFLCNQCGEVFSLGFRLRTCVGGDGGGVYLNGVRAAVWGPRETTFVLALGNETLEQALRDQVTRGDTRRKIILAYGIEPAGRSLDAWLIPEASQAVMRFATEASFDAALREIAKS
jgi:hypothetical protein